MPSNPLTINVNLKAIDAKQERVDYAWLRAALAFGLSMSKDPERKVGACIVSPDNMRASFGYNGFPSGVPDTYENWADKELKNAIVKHAEENAVSKAPFDTTHATCYVTLKPCHQCLGTLVNARVARVVFLEDPEGWAYEDVKAFELVRTSSGIKVLMRPRTTFENAMIGAWYGGTQNRGQS